MSLGRQFRRILWSDIPRIPATDDEREVLATAGIYENAEQNYAAWRRPMLWMAALAWMVTAMFAGWNATRHLLDQEVQWIFQLFTLATFAITLCVSGLTVLAAMTWTRPRSKSHVRAAWLIALLGPFLIYLLPARWFVDPGEGPNALLVFSFLIGAKSLFILGPSVIGLFAGFLRSSLTLKTMRPHSSAPGQIALVVAPSYALMFALALVLVAQIGGSVWLFASLACFLFYPISLLVFSRELLRPLSENEARDAVALARQVLGTILVAGLILLVLYLFKSDLWRNFIGPRGLLQFIAGLIGNVLLVTVALCDLILDKTE